jgi:alcohol/geraniol dehydrogenase (NADP+)
MGCEVVPTIIGHQGSFADRIRSHWLWAIPLPDALDISSAGALLCAGATMFSPLVTFGVKPIDQVGIVGIGGLGHLGIKFANAWGCEVTAFTSNESKAEEAKGSVCTTSYRAATATKFSRRQIRSISC